MYTRWPSCLALFIADTKKALHLKPGFCRRGHEACLLGSAKCRAESCARALTHTPLDLSVKMSKFFFICICN